MASLSVELTELDKGSLSDLGQNLASADPQVRLRAVSAVAEAGSAAVELLPHVLALARADSSLAVRQEAVRAVASIGTGNARQAAAALEELVVAEEGQIRAAAARGLGALRVVESLGLLGRLLADPQMLVREAALSAVGAFGTAGSPELQGVVANLDVPLVRVEAIGTLGKLGPSAAGHAAALVGFLLDSDVRTRVAVADALLRLRSHVLDDVVDRVGELLNHQSDRFRATAAMAMGSLGEAKAGQHKRTLLKMLRENTIGPATLSPAFGAAIGLGRLGGQGEELERHLASKRPEVRAAICEGLTEMGAEGLHYQARLMECLQDPDERVRVAAARSLNKLRDATAGKLS
mmetsp:Transcript_22144/g.61950  ORF Transcript_22144/g.61950 Transcript_22144/m.61950 type:complete len:349 (+) Transcript_22144:49-1095(+)